MKEAIEWLTKNPDVILDIVKLLVAIGAYIYAGIIHWKSKVKINELQAKADAESELIKQLKELKEALERSK